MSRKKKQQIDKKEKQQVDQKNKTHGKLRLPYLLYTFFALSIPAVAVIVYKPEKPMSTFKKTRPIDTTLHSIINRIKPEYVLMGNSMVGKGINNTLFSRLMKAPSYKAHWGGAASAMWYMALKHMVLAKHQPKTVIVFFRDQFLTDPTFRTHGEYWARINKYTHNQEPLLEQLVYRKGLTTWRYQIKKHVGLWRERGMVKDRIASAYCTAVTNALLHQEEQAREDQFKEAFDDNRKIPSYVTQQQLAAETLKNEALLNFNKNVGQSFLPAIIDIVHDANIKLVLVRIKRRERAMDIPEPEALQQYIIDLESYLSSRDVPMIDFTHDSRITIDHFGAGDHMSTPAGQIYFTKLLVSELLRRQLNLD